jgi:acyl-CoA thioesterase I
MTKRRWTYVCAGAILQVALLAGCSPAGDSSGTNAAAPAERRVQATPSAAMPVSGPERLVLAFGDSLYAGYGLKPDESLPADLEALLRGRGIDARLVNGGVSGDTSAAGVKRLAFTLDRLERKPDLVLLGLGGNDVLRQIPVEETRANLVIMLDMLKARGIPVMLTGMLAPPNLGPDYADRFNAIFPELAKMYGAPLDPFILAGVLGDRRLMLPDGIHPNAQGVDVMARRIAPLIAQRLAELPR